MQALSLVMLTRVDSMSYAFGLGAIDWRGAWFNPGT